MLKERDRERLNPSPTRSASEGWLRRDSCGVAARIADSSSHKRSQFSICAHNETLPARCGAIRRALYTQPDDAVDYAKFFSSSHDAVIHVYDEAGNVGSKRPSTRAISKSREPAKQKAATR
jgi:hypothetical protein